VIRKLRLFQPFAGLDAATLDELLPALEELRLEAGEVLMRRGDAAEHMYLLLSGELSVESPGGEDQAPLARIGAGELVGELAVLAGGARSATVRALEMSELVRLPHAALERALERHPAALEHFVDTVRRRIWRSQLATHLPELFGSPDPAVLAEIERDMESVSLRSGEDLFRHGDPGDAAYILISGRLRVVDGGERMLNDVAAGETLGEMALLVPEARSATVFAVRDSQLAKLPAAAFQRLIDRHPGILRRITEILVERLRAHSGARSPRRAAVKTIAIVAAGPSGETAEFARRLADALSVHGTLLHQTSLDVDRALGRPGISVASERDAAGVRLLQWLNEQELAHDFVLYEADAHASAWTERAVRQADHVLFVADTRAGPGLGAQEQMLAKRWRGARAPKRSLILLRASDSGEPHDTAAFLDGRVIDRHYHLVADSRDDFARLARWLTGRGVGLVLGGGGARGFAHLGVVRALVEAGVPIDWVAGTSIGAIVGASIARGDTPDELHAHCKKHFASIFDLTLPIVSLLTGRRIRAQLDAGFGFRAIEDLQLPFLCVSTNLSRAEQAVHERGPLVRAVRASISLPGILPPVTMGVDLHVDGALVNNLPIDIVVARPEIGSVIAVDVSPEIEMRASDEVLSEFSGWRLLWQRIRPFGKRTELPSIAYLLARSSVVASMMAARERQSAATASLYLRVPVADLKLLDFERIDEIAARGYDSTHKAIREWWANQSGEF